eukprot:5148115-Pleurochrysis_carterae.AAC.1
MLSQRRVEKDRSPSHGGEERPRGKQVASPRRLAERDRSESRVHKSRRLSKPPENALQTRRCKVDGNRPLDPPGAVQERGRSPEFG